MKPWLWIILCGAGEAMELWHRKADGIIASLTSNHQDVMKVVMRTTLNIEETALQYAKCRARGKQRIITMSDVMDALEKEEEEKHAPFGPYYSDMKTGDIDRNRDRFSLACN